MAQSANIQQYHPVKRAFIGINIIGAVITLIVTVGVSIIGLVINRPMLLLALPIGVVLGILQIINSVVAYKKQRYDFHSSYIHHESGGLLSHSQTNLEYRNITQVRVVKPFIEYHLFGTGNIYIDSAGSNTVPVVLRSVDQPYQVFQEIKEKLADQTFALSYQKLLSHKQPSPFAVIIRGVLPGLVPLVSIAVAAILSSVPSLALGYGRVGLIMLVAFGFLVIGAALFGYLLYQSLVRHDYYVYQDVIHYSKGYLTRQEAFVPMENLANVDLTQNLFGKIFNIQDITISPQGGGANIVFSNIIQGKGMQMALTAEIHKQASVDVTPTKSPRQVDIRPSNYQPDHQTDESTDSSVRQFRMSMARQLVPIGLLAVLFFLLLPIWLVLAIVRAVQVKATVYQLTERGVASYYSFLSTRNTEFTKDKLTGVVIKRSPFDRWFNTCTVQFWTIGSSGSMTFEAIAYDENIEALVRQTAGVVDDQELEILRPEFSLATWAASRVELLVSILIGVIVPPFLSFLMPGLWLISIFLVILVSINLVVLKRRYDRAWLRLGQSTAAVQIGVLWQKTEFTHYKNVKSLSLTRYVGSTFGQICFNVAGQSQFMDNNNSNQSNQPAAGPTNAIRLDYLRGVGVDVVEQRDWLDRVIVERPNSKSYAKLRQAGAPKVIYQSAPMLRNSMIGLSLLHVVILPILPLLPLSLLFARWRLRRMSYLIDELKISFYHGIFYKQRTAISFAQLDYAEVKRGAFNTMLGNGNVLLYTAGSASAELTLNNMADDNQFYQLVTRLDDQQAA